MSNISEAKKEYSLSLSQLNLFHALEKSELNKYLQKDFTDTFFSTISSSDFTAPSLLLFIINKETKIFLAEIEKADLELEIRANKNTQKINQAVETEKIDDNDHKNFTRTDILHQVSADNNHSQNVLLNTEDKKNFQNKIIYNDNDNVCPQNSPEQINNKKDPNEENGTQINEKVLDSKNLVSNLEENERLPVAEIILASHATLLLHTIYTCLPVERSHENTYTDCTYSVENSDCPADKLEKKMGISRVTSSEIHREEKAIIVIGKNNKKKKNSDDIDGLNRTNIKYTNSYDENEIESAIEISSEPGASRFSIRNGLPRGSWWLTVRVLKGFLVLQGQVMVVIFYASSPTNE